MTEDHVPAGKLYENNMKKNIFFASLKSLKKKGVDPEFGSGSGSGSISQRYGFANLDPYRICPNFGHGPNFGQFWVDLRFVVLLRDASLF
jgi:hypothetical protein